MKSNWRHKARRFEEHEFERWNDNIHINDLRKNKPRLYLSLYSYYFHEMTHYNPNRVAVICGILRHDKDHIWNKKIEVKEAQASINRAWNMNTRSDLLKKKTLDFDFSPALWYEWCHSTIKDYINERWPNWKDELEKDFEEAEANKAKFTNEKNLPPPKPETMDLNELHAELTKMARDDSNVGIKLNSMKMLLDLFKSHPDRIENKLQIKNKSNSSSVKVVSSSELAAEIRKRKQESQNEEREEFEEDYNEEDYENDHHGDFIN